MHESGGNPAQHRQLALVLRMLVESAEAWPTGLLIRFDGPTLMSKMHKEVGKIKTFGPHGPQYQVDGWPLIQLDDEDWLVGVTLVASGEKVEYRLSKVMEDPEAR